MSETLSLIGVSTAWFTPLAAIRVYENAYALSYTGVNLASLSMTLFFVMSLGLLYSVLPYPKTIGWIGAAFSTIGFAILLAASYSVKSTDIWARTAFWVATGLIGFNFADILLKSMVQAMSQSQKKIEAGQTNAANRVGSLNIIGLPVGMLLALVITEMIYDVQDTYFTNDV
jgi:hypothetical protein